MNDNSHSPTEPNSPQPQYVGIVARFASPADLLAAARQISAAGYSYWDCHTPFPIHGLDRAMKIRPTILPWLVAGAGATGAVGALVLQWWANGVAYPLIISGKPYFSLPANVPIIFELTVLFAALTAFFGAILLNGLPRLLYPASTAASFARVTTDAFLVSIEAKDPQFHPERTAEWLRTLGAESVELCPAPEGDDAIPAVIKRGLLVLAVLALLPPLFIALARQHTTETPQEKPRIHIIKDMDFQPKYETQAVSPLFADRRAMRPRVPGTVPFDPHWQPPPEGFLTGKVGNEYLTEFPIPVNEDVMRRGRERYDIYCATCHGWTGEAGQYDGMTSRRARARGETTWVPPASLTGQAVREQPVGKIFETITQGMVREGVYSMPPYAVQIPPEDRWAIVLYVRALQRARAPYPEDFQDSAPSASASAANPAGVNDGQMKSNLAGEMRR